MPTATPRRRIASFHAFAAALCAAAVCAACGGGGAAPAPGPGPGSGPIVIPAEFVKQVIDTRSYPDAVCNDGSPAVFYIQRGLGTLAAANTDKTVIGLQGGGYCLRDADCSLRASELVSSISYPSRVSSEGMLSGDADNPTFRSWNRVRVPYCSSDFFTGDTGPTGGTTNYRFRGAKILAAVVQTLNSQYGIGKPGDTVILAGSSAGAVGAFINANRVRAMLPGATLLTLIDAGVYPDAPPPVPPSTPPAAVRDLGAIGIRYWNGQVDADCAAANPGNPGLCYLFEHAQPTLRTPFFIAQNARDGVGIGNVGFLDTATNLEEPTIAAWIDGTYLPAIRDILGGVGLSVGQGVFATCDSTDIHTLSSTDALWTRSIAAFGGRSLEGTVAAWVAGGRPATQLLAPDCRFP